MLGHCDNNSQEQFVPHRIANVWNSLPAADTDFTDLISFRASMQNTNLRTFARFQSRYCESTILFIIRAHVRDLSLIHI